MTDHMELLEDTRKKLLEIVNDTTGWSKCQNVSKILITKKKSPYFAGNMFKAELEIDAHFEKVAKTWTPKPKGLRQDWDKTMVSSDCIHDINKEAMIVRTVSPSVAMGLIASREFIDLMMLRFLDDGQTAMTVGISVEHKDYPAQSSPVRGKNYPCGSILTKISSDKTKMTYIGHSEIGGSVPLSLVESALPSTMHSMLDGLRKQVIK